jgi:hypothetical protein
VLGERNSGFRRTGFRRRSPVAAVNAAFYSFTANTFLAIITADIAFGQPA